MSGSNIDQLRQAWRLAQDFVGSRKKVFLVGSAKSGTTWLMNMLNGHPQMVVKGEGRFAWKLVPFIGQAFKAFNDDQAKHSEDPCMLMRDVDLLMCARSLIDIQLFRYIETSGKSAGSIQVVGDKTPQHTQSMDMLAQMYPDAKFIHIIRDPRDAATSGWHHFGPDSQRNQQDYLSYFIQQVWPAAINASRASARRLPGMYLEVRYEDLHVAEQVMTVKCLEFLGVDSSIASVIACIKAGSFKERSGGRERGQRDDKSFYRSGVIGDWANHLTPEAAATACAPIADLMRSCGYDPVAGLKMGAEVNPAVLRSVAEAA